MDEETLPIFPYLFLLLFRAILGSQQHFEAGRKQSIWPLPSTMHSFPHKMSTGHNSDPPPKGRRTKDPVTPPQTLNAELLSKTSGNRVKPWI